MNSNNNSFEIDIIPNEKLENKQIVKEFVKNIKHNYIKLELNHKYTNTSPIVLPTFSVKNWNKLHDALDKEFERKGIHDKDDIDAIHDTVDDNHERIAGINDYYNNYNDNSNESKEAKEKPKREITTFKYSKLGQGGSL
jgi:hypothetical protein